MGNRSFQIKRHSLEIDIKMAKALGYRPSKIELTAADRICRYLEKSAQAIPESLIMASVTGRKQIKVAALRALVAAKLVCKSGRGKKGDSYLYILSDEFDAIKNPEPQETPAYSQIETLSEILDSDSPKELFKRLPLSDGSLLSVTTEEFQSIVEFFRMLNEHSK